MENKRLYRSNRSSYLGGVCGGLADYFNIDPVLVRIIFVLVFIYGGAGLLIYLILWIVIPKEPLDFFKYSPNPGTGGASESGIPNDPESPRENQSAPFTGIVDTERENRKKNGALIGGIILVAVGTLFLFDNLIDFFSFHDFWPAVLVIAGVAIILSSINTNKKKDEL